MALSQHLHASCGRTDSTFCANCAPLQMRADQFVGLSSLTALGELDVSSTGFDDACCRELAPLAGLTNIK